MKDLIGRKVKGFKFDGDKYECGYCPSMNENIDKKGIITRYDSYLHCYDIDFGNTHWVRYSYPAELIEQHLID